MGSMPWLAVEYSSEEKRKELAEQQAVRGIPALHKVDLNDKTVDSSWRGKSEEINKLT